MASWALPLIEQLGAGRSVRFRPTGNSMEPRIKSGQLVTVVPTTIKQPSVGDVVLCRVSGVNRLHLVTATDGRRYQISNNKGHVNGWCTFAKIYGVMTEVH